MTISASTGTITIPANLTAASLVVTPLRPGHGVNATLSVALAPSNNYTFTPGSGTITLRELSTITQSASDPDAKRKGDTGTWTLSRNGTNLAASLTIKFTLSGSALLGTDYSLSAGTGAANVTASGTTGTITFAPNQSTAKLTLKPTKKKLAVDKAVSLALAANAVAYDIGSTSATTVTIHHV